jgi:hypothetical protein
MPRKHRAIRSGLSAKGFEVEENRKHIHFVYVDIEGRTTTARSMLSHAAGGEDVSDNLLGQMAKQVGLKRTEFLEMVDCPMSREDFDARIRAEDDSDAS